MTSGLGKMHIVDDLDNNLHGLIGLETPWEKLVPIANTSHLFPPCPECLTCHFINAHATGRYDYAHFIEVAMLILSLFYRGAN